ncbi:hypothetical protein SDC9_95115 [bioreactor metagenome]|uniref:Uncharacterized protein n=1 Tax=bioreactor metagenome TaxID=1076179 RepID=A0A645A5B3_9ZZZZ
MTKRLPSHNVPLPLVADVVCYVNNKGSSRIEELRAFTNKSDAYIRSCLAICKLLDIIHEDGTVSSFVNELGKTPNEALKLNVLRKLIQEFEPFIIFIQYHLNGESLEDSARKVYTAFKFEGKDYLFLKDLFLAWGMTTDIFSPAPDSFVLETDIQERISIINSFAINLDDDMAIRMYIGNSLGADVFSSLLPAELAELVDAYKKCETDARGAIECTGRAFEDFLRRISLSVNIDASGKNGIGQIVNALYNHKNAAGILDNKIHSKQSSIGSAIADIRNMAGHSLEARTLERWDLTSHSAKMYAELVLSTIKSISNYVQHSNHTF